MQNEIIEETKKFVKDKLENEKSGHDWYHIQRVHKIAKRAAELEGADTFVVEIAALLHDIGENGPAEIHVVSCANTAKDFLSKFNIEEKALEHICDCILSHSWSDKIGKPKTIEAKIVADCDALDATGALGICRTIQYYAAKGGALYDPTRKPNPKFDGKSTTMVNHFYEKLLLLDNTMFTETCRNIAKKRIEFMKYFLEEFLEEWEGNK